MTRDDIIKMAREAGAELNSDLPDWSFEDDQLESFAAIVAAAEREKVAAWMMERGYATGHGDSTQDLLTELDWQIRDQAEKQEPVTFVCSTGFCRFTLTQTDVGIGDAQAIRARGEQ